MKHHKESNITNVFYGHHCCKHGCEGNSTEETNLIDDNITSKEKTWSSEKIKNEIKENTITKFGDLHDVDVSNKKNEQVVVYNEQLGKFTTMDLKILDPCMCNEAGIKQVCKLGVEGTAHNPEIIDITISTKDFKVPKVNVLKFQPKEEGSIEIINTFSNGEESSFQDDTMIVFDNTAHLKTVHEIVLDYEGDIDKYKSYSGEVDKSLFKEINSIVEKDGSTLTMNAIPKDRILVPKEDFNLTNAMNINYFNLIATSVVKVVCSTDSGSTWKTLKNGEWINIDLNVEDVYENGIDVNDFNSIEGVKWNDLITDKIRFAYLLTDDSLVDELKVSFSGKGHWIEAKDSEYDVVYASNNSMQVYIKINGDVKINY